MSALLAQPRRGFAELDFQETRPSFRWPQETRPPQAPERRVAPPRALEPAPAPHPLRPYHDLTTAAWLDDDIDGVEPGAALDAVDRQSWALARLVCGAALAVGALGLASYLIG